MNVSCPVCFRRRGFLILTLCASLFFLGTLGLYPQDTRGAYKVATANLGASATIGRQYALFIAIDTYRSWAALKKPVADAREIKEILQNHYYIDEFIELYNRDATKENIMRVFRELQGKLQVHDSLFIYYAGHGHLDDSSNAGFWIPVDGGTNENIQENWLPNSQIRGFISRFKTIHVFMVSDACFSGDILNPTRAQLPPDTNEYYRRAYGLISRQVLTSGSSETVPDESEFSQALKFCLRKNTKSLLDPVGIYNDVRLAVRSTTPLYGTLSQASHQEGATFLFFRKQEGTPRPAENPPPVSGSAVAGSLSVSSEIPGMVLLDGVETGTRIKSQGTVVLGNISTGLTEVAVKEENGRITKASDMVLVKEGQTVRAAIERPAPPVPRNVRGGMGPDQIILFWESAGSEIRYKIYYNTQNDPARAGSLSDLTDETSVAISSLSSGTNYYFWVSSVQNGRESDKSPVLSVRTAAAPPPERSAPQPVLLAPRNVRAGTPETDRVTLFWESAGSGIRYKIYYNTQNDPARAGSLSNLADGTSVTISSLSSGTNYYFWVSSVQNGRESDKSPALSVRTAAAPPPESPSSSDIPDWFLNPPGQEDGIFGSGSAKMSNLNMTITMAESRARQSLAFTLNAHVQAMLTDYCREAGIQGYSYLSFAESIARQLTNAKLTGVVTYKRYQAKDGTFYTLVCQKKADAIKAAVDVIESEASRYAEFKAMDAWKRMEIQLSKTNIKLKPVTGY